MQNETITSDILRETIHTQLIDPGLRVFVLQKPGFQKQYALFATHYGSINTHFTVADADDHITVCLENHQCKRSSNDSKIKG